MVGVFAEGASIEALVCGGLTFAVVFLPFFVALAMWLRRRGQELRWEAFPVVNFSIPRTEDLHSVLLAFFRTSDFGGWQVDDSKQNDIFVLNFRREKNKTRSVNVAKIPMRLQVTLRPSPRHVKVGLEFLFESPNNRLESSRKLAADHIDKEANSLLWYLQEFYGLAETPMVEK